MRATNEETHAIGKKLVKPPASAELVALVERSLDADQAEEVAVIDLTGKSSIADSMVVASGRSTRQVGAMAEHLIEALKAAGIKPVPVEGLGQLDWVLIDAGDVIVHLFRPEIRSFYNLEKMWAAPPSDHSRQTELIA